MSAKTTILHENGTDDELYPVTKASVTYRNDGTTTVEGTLTDYDTLETKFGDTSATLPTTAQTVIGAIAEHESNISDIKDDISTLNGNLTKKLIVDHSNEYTIKSGDSLNDYTESGVYNCTSASIAQTLTGKPSAITTGFKLVCMTAGYNSIIAYGLQIIFAGSGTGTPRIFVRSGKTGGDWSQWYQVSTTTVS